MKKQYEAPRLICEELQPEQMLCGCKYKNPNLNEEWHCSFKPDGLDFTIFAELWSDCFLHPDDVPSLGLCYHPGPTNLFSS